jgi:hypothetical protein
VGITAGPGNRRWRIVAYGRTGRAHQSIPGAIGLKQHEKHPCERGKSRRQRLLPSLAWVAFLSSQECVPGAPAEYNHFALHNFTFGMEKIYM